MATVFFSWQADRSKLTGRNLIERALRDAINELNSDAELDEAEREVELDSDTKGVPGSPPIVETIFKKIDAASVFVPDLTFVGTRGKGRPTPNPNVLIEYGWALRSLTHTCIVAGMNSAHGEPTRESLPFDLGHMRRPIVYECADDADEATRQRARKGLAAELKKALRDVLSLPKVDVAMAQPAPYVAREPMDGQGRFRNGVEPIGRLYNSMPFTPQDEKQVFLPPGGSMWLRLMPTIARDGEILITRAQAAMLEGGRSIRPLNFHNEAITPHGVRGHDGFGLCVNLVDEKASAVIYAFTSGEVWTIDTALLSYEPNAIIFDETKFVAALIDCAILLRRLGIEGPYRWIAGMDGVRGRRLSIAGRGATFPTATWNNNVVTSSGGFSGAEDEAVEALEPFFVKVFDNAHLTRQR